MFEMGWFKHHLAIKDFHGACTGKCLVLSIKANFTLYISLSRFDLDLVTQRIIFGRNLTKQTNQNDTPWICLFVDVFTYLYRHDVFSY